MSATAGIRGHLVLDDCVVSAPLAAAVTARTASRARMFASCPDCGARSATFSHGPGGAIRASRWESQHRCPRPERRHGPHCPKNPDAQIRHMVDFCTCPGGRGR